MKTIRKFLFLSLIAGITAFSCEKESSNNNSLLGEPFQIKLNETFSITQTKSDANNPDSTINVSFKKVLSDSRCPMDICYLCYGSSASIQLFLSHKADTATLTLTILGCREEYECDDNLFYRVDTLGYRFCLLRLDLYPNGNPINLSNYSAKLNISKL